MASSGPSLNLIRIQRGSPKPAQRGQTHVLDASHHARQQPLCRPLSGVVPRCFPRPAGSNLAGGATKALSGSQWMCGTQTTCAASAVGGQTPGRPVADAHQGRFPWASRQAAAGPARPPQSHRAPPSTAWVLMVGQTVPRCPSPATRSEWRLRLSLTRRIRTTSMRSPSFVDDLHPWVYGAS
jgi:hypothetical protein